MDTRKKIAIAVAALFGLVLVALVAAPFLFRDRIEARLESEAEQAVEADVAWEGLSLSLLRRFPNLDVRLDDLSVVGVEEFEGDTLAAMARVRVVLDLGSVWRYWRRGEPLVVRAVDLDRPAVRLVRLEDGTANWDIARERPEETAPEEGRDLSVSLRRFTVRDGSLAVDDRQAGLNATLDGYDQTLAGDFRREQFLLRTRAQADRASLRFGGVPFLRGARLAASADIDANMAERRFAFQDNEVRLNDLLLGFSGSARDEGENWRLDVTFGAPDTEFGSLLSLVPAVYARDFESLETSGNMVVEGRVEGLYGDEAFPSFAIAATVENGRFQYPDKPLPARDIHLDLAVRNPGGDLDSTVVDLRRLHAVIGNDPIEGSLTLRNPVSDPDVDLRVAGRLDLGALDRTVKLEGVEELTGVVSADAAIRTRRSFLETQQYDRVTASGGARATEVVVRAEDLRHPVEIEEAVLQLAPGRAELTSFRGRLGSSDVLATARIDNLLGFTMRDEELRGRATLQSRRFDLNEWRSEDEELDVIPVPGNVDFALQVDVDELVYGTLVMRQARGRVLMDDRRLTLEDFRAGMLDGQIALSGFYETTDVERPTFQVNLQMQDLAFGAAVEELVTVRTLAPVARYARGSFSTDVQVHGALGGDMLPLFDVLGAEGSFQTSRLEIQGFPPLERMGEALGIARLANPTLEPVRAGFDVRDGRMHLRPFDVRLGDLRMTVEGSHGIDQSLQYGVRLEAPPGILGEQGQRTVAGLLERAGRVGVDLQAADLVQLGLQLTGTVTDPSVEVDLGGLGETVREGVGRAVEEEAGRRLREAEEDVEQRVEEATEAGRAEAERLIRQAEERADTVRAEARRLAERVREEGYARADSLLARAEDPLARAAAQVAADRVRREADNQAERIVREADARADSIVAEARRRADQPADDPDGN